MKQVYLIGAAHIDPVWLWNKSEGLSEILSTFRSALDRMEEFPNYVFTSACAGYYQWVEQIDPGMFQQIQRRVKEGRWSVVGGMWVQPDCNIPCGESFARHLLYSQRYFQEKFGQTATVGYNVDSFGHNGMLPQLLQKAGITNYVFMRPSDTEKPNLPQNLFWWQSPDGSRVLTHRITYVYNDNWGPPPGTEACSAKVEALRRRALEDGHPYLDFYGVGNHGGGPTIRGLQALTQVCQNQEDVCFSGTPTYFADLLQSGITGGLITVKEDLQHHASGCYSANAAVKTANRKAEQALIKAEKYDLLCHLLLGTPTHNSEIRAAWEKVLFNQFHDVLAGCCIREAYGEALNSFGAAADTAAQLASQALHRMAWNVRTTNVLNHAPAQKNGWILWEKQGEGAPVVVFNPHSFPLDMPVQLNTTVSGVTDNEGRPVPSQTVRGPQTNGGDLGNTLFWAHVPALGYACYHVYKDEVLQAPAGAAVSATQTTLENDCLRVVFDQQSGGIASYFDKETGREYAAGPLAKAVVIDDTLSDTWAHERFVFDKEIGSFSNAQFRVLDNGPIRAGVRVVSRYGSSELIQDFYLYPGKKELEVRARLRFYETLKIIKLSFPLRIADPVAVYSMPYGFVQKEPDGLEQPAQDWICTRERSSGEGLALLNDCKYSFSVKDNDMRMIIARGCFFADHFGQRDDLMEPMDQGDQLFSYVLTPCGADPSDVVKRAALLNAPPDVLMETHHNGPLEPFSSGISIAGGSVGLSSMKAAENGRGIVLRLYETSGKAAKADVSLLAPAVSFSVTLKPQEVKTLYLPLIDGKAAGEISEILLTELDCPAQ